MLAPGQIAFQNVLGHLPVEAFKVSQFGPRDWVIFLHQFFTVVFILPVEELMQITNLKGPLINPRLYLMLKIFYLLVELEHMQV